MTSEDTQTMNVKCTGSLTVRAAAPIVDAAGVDCGHSGDQQQGEGGEGDQGAGVARRGHALGDYLTATVKVHQVVNFISTRTKSYKNTIEQSKF